MKAAWRGDVQEDKIFEKGLVQFRNGVDDRWRKIADYLHDKSANDVRAHYEALLYDISEIDSGWVQLPCYSDESEALGWDDGTLPKNPGRISFGSQGGTRTRQSDVERKKGIP
ncbi:hypothetical protein BUALT_Bualt04G0147100 [Buddleja alternifolia]|uniref:Myb-like domain-containing protein n=1 Tax=Buddleja alternifolia TaxID=168488 RepID=A0AAV6XZQ6_9LAMI|nr:hypothetical protein BUALT_Bualt04G0147100 [Buddleja alternifolia]